MVLHDKDRLRIVGWAALHALGAAAYVLLLVAFIQNFFAQDPEGPLGMAGVMLLFSLSAAVMGSLVFGRPVLWYLDGKKKEAIALALYTIFFLFVATILVLWLAGVVYESRPHVLPVY